MKKIIQAAAVALSLASAAQAQEAQQAVQWKVSDGGNGHWYRVDSTPGLSWSAARDRAALKGGALASVTTTAENDFIGSMLGSITPGPGYWLGAYFQSGSWHWLSGEPWNFTSWGGPGNGCTWQQPSGRDAVDIYCIGNDGSPHWSDDYFNWPNAVGLVIEWSADCNGDGIVDYGQCHDGTLPDYNGNNIPDCCERSEACVVGNYPVQWRIEDGGNGHWYRRVNPNSNLTWTQAETLCELIGAHLATVPAASESAFVHLIVGQSEVYLGGLQPPNSCEPNCEWQWLTGEPWSYTNWNPGEPNNSNAEQNFLRTYPNGSWDDVQDGYAFPFAIAAEWDADCNSDGVVDYGQILAGQLADANTNGIPDICEGPTCRDADLFRNGVINGADLGILLSQWGPAPAGTVSDINRDGQVNGADLGYLLNAWGPCTN
jgi:hypothetical protein